MSGQSAHYITGCSDAPLPVSPDIHHAIDGEFSVLRSKESNIKY